MFNNSNGFTMPVAPIAYGNNGGFGGFGDDWIGLIIILALLGWGGNGFGGGFGGFGGNRGGCVEPCATQADVRAAVDQQTLISKLDQQTYGLADSTYALNNTITNGFHGVDNAICNLGYNVQSGFNGLSAQLAQCCCDNRAAIAEVRYDMATQACDTRHAIQDSTRQILDFLTTDKIAALQAENQSLKTQIGISNQNAYITANQEAQTATLLRRLGAECPQAAYIVNAPTPVTFPVNSCGQFSGYGYNGSCGCGCA